VWETSRPPTEFMLVNGTSGYNDGDFAEFDDDHGCHEVCQQGNEAIVWEDRS